MIDFLAPLFGRRVVFLLDHDGEVTKRWAKPTPFGLTCSRYGWGVDHCLLLPSGEVNGPLYVKSWSYPTPTEGEGRE